MNERARWKFRSRLLSVLTNEFRQVATERRVDQQLASVSCDDLGDESELSHESGRLGHRRDEARPILIAMTSCGRARIHAG
jgi:hypothetical protein